MQVSNNKSAKAENTTQRNELSALQDQLSASSRQLEAEQATSEEPPDLNSVAHAKRMLIFVSSGVASRRQTLELSRPALKSIADL